MQTGGVEHGGRSYTEITVEQSSPMQEVVRPAPGDLLVAPPEMKDPNFRRSVVVVCEHQAAGSFGLALNFPLEAQMSDLPLELSSDALLSLGGPVQTDTLHYLHLHGDAVAESVPLKGHLAWGGNFETVRFLLEAGAATRMSVRFFLGYAGWSAGQLEEEIRCGGWFVVRGKEHLVFMDQPASLWRTVLTQMGGEYALLVNYPDDPRLN